MGHPAEHGTPGQEPAFVPPEHGEIPPGEEDKPEDPETLEEPEEPEEPEQSETPDEPETPVPGENEPQPEPDATSAEAPVESLMGLRDFLAVAPRRNSAAATQASYGALERWMRQRGHDVNGFYSLAEWQRYYTEAMQYTG